MGSPSEQRLGTPARIGIVIAGTVAIWSLMASVSARVFGGDVGTVSRIVCALIVFGLAVPMIILARRFLDRRPWSSLQLPGWRRAWGPLLVGVLSFLLPASVGVGIALLAGWVRVTTTVSPSAVAAAIAFTVLTVLLLEAVPEELIFRGYLYRNLSASLAPIWAVVVQATLFAVLGTALWVTTSGWGVLAERAALFLVLGVLLGILRLISDSVWNPIGFHLAFQVVAQTLFVGTVIQVSDAGAATIAAIVPGFVCAAAITQLLSRRRPNWRRAEPDLPAPASLSA